MKRIGGGAGIWPACGPAEKVVTKEKNVLNFGMLLFQSFHIRDEEDRPAIREAET